MSRRKLTPWPPPPFERPRSPDRDGPFGLDMSRGPQLEHHAWKDAAAPAAADTPDEDSAADVERKRLTQAILKSEQTGDRMMIHPDDARRLGLPVDRWEPGVAYELGDYRFMLVVDADGAHVDARRIQTNPVAQVSVASDRATIIGTRANVPDGMWDTCMLKSGDWIDPVSKYVGEPKFIRFTVRGGAFKMVQEIQPSTCILAVFTGNAANVLRKGFTVRTGAKCVEITRYRELWCGECCADDEKTEGSPENG